jgi:MarR family 2-MHQ and catechol resistance regulon transcriptional repressor
MATHYKGTIQEVTALDSYIKLVRAVESLTARLNALLQKNGLTGSQFSVLEALYHLGPLCQTELGSKLLKSGGNITMVIDNLEKQELVKREKTQKDRRFYTIHLTERGLNLIEKIFPDHVKAITLEFSVLTEAEQTELQRMCKLIGIKKQSA